MSQTTITEALSELNLIKKKIEKKKAEVLGNLARYDHVPDTFANVGGSKEYIASQIQAIDDLRLRFVKIRSAIAKANTEHKITVHKTTRTINEWLNWKRDQADDAKQFGDMITRSLKGLIDNNAQKPSVFKDDAGNAKVVNLVANVDYAERLKANEDLLDTIEGLDGQLSLKNATIMIEI